MACCISFTRRPRERERERDPVEKGLGSIHGRSFVVVVAPGLLFLPFDNAGWSSVVSPRTVLSLFFVSFRCSVGKRRTGWGELLFCACVYNATSCLIDPSSGSSWSPRETGRLSSSLARSDDDKSWSITLSLSSPFQFRAPPFPPAIWLIPFFASLIMTASVAAAIV